MNPAKIVIEGEVSPEFLAGVQALQQRLAQTAEAAEKVAKTPPPTGLERLRESFNGVAEGARRFNELREAATGVVEGIGGAAERVAELTAAQQRITANSARLGLDFQRAAQQAGGFVSEMETMTLATALANRNINVTQRELEVLARVGMQRARDTGKEVGEVFETIGDSIVEGGGELTKFGAELATVADGSHTASDRLAALVSRGREVAPAMRTAADQMRAFQAEMERAQRTIASGFVEEWQRLASLGSPFRDARTDAAELNRELTALGQTAARVLRQTGDVLGLVGTAVAAGASRAWGAAQRGLAFITMSDVPTEDEAYGGARDLERQGARFLRDLEGLSRDAEQRTAAPATPGGAANDNARPDLVITAQELGIDPRTGRRVGAAGGGGGGGDRAIALSEAAQASLGAFGLGSALNEAVRQQAEPFGGDVAALRRANESEAGLRRAEDTARTQGEERSRAAAEAAIAAERERQDREKERENAAAEERRRDEFNTRENQTRLERERAYLDERARLQESFTERFEQLHRRQTDATDAAVATAETAWQSAGKALGQHVLAVVRGQETVGEAAIGAVTDVVTALGQESIVKAAMETAEGVAMLAGVYTAPLAPGHFAAAAAYAAVGAAALGAGAILGAATGGGASAPAAPAGPALPPPTQADAAAAGSMQLTIVYGSGILGTPHDLARNIRDTLIEGESRGIRLPSRTVDQRAA